jgi:hypothetical protein
MEYNNVIFYECTALYWHVFVLINLEGGTDITADLPNNNVAPNATLAPYVPPTIPTQAPNAPTLPPISLDDATALCRVFKFLTCTSNIIRPPS